MCVVALKMLTVQIKLSYRASLVLVVHIALLLDFDDVGEVGRVQHLLQGLALLQAVEDQAELVRLEELARHWLLLRPFTGWWEDRVQTDFQGVLQHRWDYSGQQRRRKLQAGIGVDLNQPDFEVLVNHEVQSEHLKSKLPSIGVQRQRCRSDGISRQFLHYFLRVTTIFGYICCPKLYSMSG